MNSDEKIQHLISLVDEAIANIRDYLMGDFDPMEVREDMRRTMHRLERELIKAKN